jgi:glutaredoxin 3
MTKMKVKVYTQPDCPWCDKVKDYLDQKGMLYETENIREMSKPDLLYFKSFHNTVPQVYVSGSEGGEWVSVGGYEASKNWFESQAEKLRS